MRNARQCLRAAATKTQETARTGPTRLSGGFTFGRLSHGCVGRDCGWGSARGERCFRARRATQTEKVCPVIKPRSSQERGGDYLASGSVTGLDWERLREAGGGVDPAYLHL